MGNDVQNSSQAPTLANTSTKAGIWLALAVALGLHALLLLLPLSRQVTDAGPASTQIELHLTTFRSKRMAEDTPMPDPLPAQEIAPALSDQITEPVSLAKAASQTVLPTSHAAPLTSIKRDLESMNTEQRTRLTHSILSSQFITEDSATDLLFGKPIADVQKEFTHQEFHFPQRPNLVKMLDQPMQELPFDYTPGLVYFAYDPGIKGDLQRFWDVITPEFGWTSKYGTEVKCIWVLVIAACGWK